MAQAPVQPTPPRNQLPSGQVETLGGTVSLAIYQPGQGVTSRSIVCYGRSGIGKTTMLSTIPNNGLVIEVPQLEGAGSDVLRGFGDRIAVTPVESWAGIENVYLYLEKNEHPFKWCAIDTITDFVVLARRKIIGERSLASEPHKLTLPERGQMNALVEELIYKFRTLPIFTFFLAQERSFDGDEGESSFIGPAVPPGVLTPLVSGALLVARLKMEYTLTGDPERQLFLAPSPNYYTKVRTRPGIKVPKATRTLDFNKLIPYFAGKQVEIDMVEDGMGFSIDLSDVAALPQIQQGGA